MRKNWAWIVQEISKEGIHGFTETISIKFFVRRRACTMCADLIDRNSNYQRRIQRSTRSREHRSIRRLRKRLNEGVTVLLINKRRPLPMPPYGQSARSFRIDSPFRTNIHEYAHRHSRAPVTKGAVTRDVIRTYRCPHDNPSASELSIPNELRA